MELACRYSASGADELVFLDIAASHQGRSTLVELVRRTAEAVTIPFTVGGGIRTVDDMKAMLRAGADKVSVNTAAILNPAIIDAGASTFGCQCIVVAIDARRNGDGTWRVFTHGGRKPTDLDAVDWARNVCARGAGEILLTSMDADGTKAGYDLELTRAVSDAVSIPVIASGGAGTVASANPVISVRTICAARANCLTG